MAEIVDVVQVGFECQICERAWVPADPQALTDQAKRPRRCPNHRCRTMRWDRDKYPNARPPRPTDPFDGGGVPLQASPQEAQPPQQHSRRTCYQTLPLLPQRRPPTHVKPDAGSPHDALAA